MSEKPIHQILFRAIKGYLSLIAFPIVFVVGGFAALGNYLYDESWGKES